MIEINNDVFCLNDQNINDIKQIDIQNSLNDKNNEVS